MWDVLDDIRAMQIDLAMEHIRFDIFSTDRSVDDLSSSTNQQSQTQQPPPQKQLQQQGLVKKQLALNHLMTKLRLLSEKVCDFQPAGATRPMSEMANPFIIDLQQQQQQQTRTQTRSGHNIQFQPTPTPTTTFPSTISSHYNHSHNNKPFDLSSTTDSETGNTPPLMTTRKKSTPSLISGTSDSPLQNTLLVRKPSSLRQRSRGEEETGNLPRLF